MFDVTESGLIFNIVSGKILATKANERYLPLSRLLMG
jgi:hypothetical protein